jgi:hypothetical protein
MLAEDRSTGIRLTLVRVVIVQRPPVAQLRISLRHHKPDPTDPPGTQRLILAEFAVSLLAAQPPRAGRN